MMLFAISYHKISKQIKNNNKPLNIGDFDFVFDVECLHQFDECLLEYGWDHDVHAAIEPMRQRPKVVISALFVQFNQNVKSYLILCLHFVHFVSVRVAVIAFSITFKKPLIQS